MGERAMELDKKNQQPQQLVSNEELSQPLQAMPPVEIAFAYGSGVFHQRQTSPAERMVDYIFGVESPAQWHAQNIEMNPAHYSSWLACFGGKAVADTASIVGVGVHFNPFVQWRDKVMKYGVIGVNDLVEDILTWKRLYISGRLQKPVCMLLDNREVAKKNEVNLQAALSTAMLLLPPEFSEEQLYQTICGLSYQGDVRLLFAEDKNKVPKIVQGSFANLRNLYSGPIRQAESSKLLKQRYVSQDEAPAQYEQEATSDSIAAHVHILPSNLLDRLAAKTGARMEAASGKKEAVADALSKMHHCGERKKLIRQAVAGIVRTSSIKQALSGFIAAGGVNAVRYASRKITKAWQS